MSIEVLESKLMEMGLTNIDNIRYNLTTAQLYEDAIRRGVRLTQPQETGPTP